MCNPIIRGVWAVWFSLLAFGAAAEPVGRVLMAVGDVVANRGGSAVVLGTGTPIESGDQIRTGSASSVQIRFSDNSIIALKPQTVFTIDEFVFAGRADGSERALFNLIAGGMRTVTGLIGKLNQRNYAIKTPTATVGIRGSGFNLAVCTPGAPCVRGDGSRARDGTYGQVFDLRIFSQTNAGTQDWQRGDVFLIPDANSLGERLREVPDFLAHNLSERSRNAGRAPTPESATSSARQASDASGAPATGGDGRATEPPAAPVPTQFVAAETRAAGGAVSVLPNITITGFIVGYTFSGSAEFLSDCFSPPCGTKDITSPQGIGTRLTGYTTTTSSATLDASGATPANLQTLDLGGSIMGVYQLAGPLSGVSRLGTPFSNPPGAYLVAFTNDPAAQGFFALPTTGNFSFGGGGNAAGLMADSASNVATITISGTFNAVSRNASFSGSGTFANVSPTFGSASLSFGGGGVVPPGENRIQGTAISYSCTGPGCQSASGSGSADIGFLRNSNGLKAMFVNGGFSNATKPGNTVIFIGAGKCVSGPC